MTRSPGAWPRKSSSVHRKRRESTTAEGPCTPSGCQRAVGSGRYRSPSSRYLYRVPGATLAMVRVKTSSAPRVIGWGRRPSIATSTDQDRKSTRLNSSHGYISYAVFCLKKKKKDDNTIINKTTSEL